MRNTMKTILINCLALAVLAPLALANNPVPFIVSTTPASAQPGAAAFTLTVYGANFVNGSIVRWVQNQTTTALDTTYVSAHELTATVPASLLAAPGTGALTVGGVSFLSNVVYFPVGPPSSPTYTPHGQTVGNGPVSVAVADFNGDGIPDLVVVNSQDNTVSVLLGKGDGTFPTNDAISIGNQPVFVVTGDFNNDGIPDIAVANQGSDTVDILFGNGDGTFTNAESLDVGSQQIYLATGDFNCDGYLDLVVVTPATVYILINSGDGTFPGSNNLSAPGLSFLSVAVADFNNDGILDLALGTVGGAIPVLLGDGTGHFSFSGAPSDSGQPQYLAAGGFNGDGNANLFVTNSAGTALFILQGNGDATFSDSFFGLGATSMGVAMGDLNGDGIPDLAIVTGTNTLSTALGTGNAPNPFATGPSFTLPEGGQFTQVAVADFNGDGILDMAVGNQSGNVVTILVSPVPVAGISPGSLTFAAQTDGTSSASQPVTVANTGQGPLFIAAIAANGDFSQTNNCGTSLAAGATCTVNVTFTPTATGLRAGGLTVTDNSNGVANSFQTVFLTGTGLIPVPIVGPLPSQMLFPNQTVNTTSASQSFYLSNTGNGALTILGIGTTGPFAQTNNCGTSLAAGAYCTINVVFSPSSPGVSNGTVGIVDNNDNVSNSLQIVNLSGNGVTAPSASISSGSLTFATQLMETASASQTITFGNAANAAQLIVTAVAATGDFSETNNCVGNLQGGASCTINVTFTPTAAGTRTGTLTVTDNNNGATGSTQTISLTGWGRPAGENATPFISDISPVSAVPGGAKFILTVRGSGFTAPELDWQIGKTVTKLTASNITDESFTVTIPASLIHTARTGTLTAVNPDSAPASGVSNPVLFPVGSAAASPIFSLTSIKDGAAPTAVATADFNGDGRADMAVINSAGTVSIFLNNGAGGFHLASRLLVGANPAAVAVGDFNGDGKPDLAVVNSGSLPVDIFLGNGDGTFSTAATVAVGEQAAALVIGDFNGDGYLDLAVANMGLGGFNNTAAVSILLGNGDGTFGPLSTLSMGTNAPVALAAGDFNGDGKLDMAVVQESGIVSILLGNGDGTFNAGATPVAASGSAIATGDFNGDGNLDLAVTNYAGGAVTILLGAGDGTFTAGASPATGREPLWVTAGDFNGDGKLDLAVANYEDGTVSILQGNGDGTFTTAATPGAGKSPMALAVADFNGDGKLDVAATSAQSMSILIQPAFSVSSAELRFTTAFGTTSAPQTVTVTNTGTAAVSFTSVTVGGAKAADFGWANDCGGSLLPAATCAIQATYTPDRKNETVSATLTLTDSEGKQVIALSGTDQ